jgi:hypothetical protein
VEEETLKKPRAPKWWLNTNFIFGFLLAIIGIMGMAKGSDFIRDPGQVANGSLPLFYLLAAVVFVVNGLVSHRSSMKAHEEENDA